MTCDRLSSNQVKSRGSFSKLFFQFIKFGFLAWGGPIAQIDMLRKEVVEEQGWISPRHFNRVLAIYQALPGPEATELCVYFGYLKLGRLGGLIAGLGFFLPGFILMLILSWFYTHYGLNSQIATSLFYGGQAAVAALIIRSLHRISKNALLNHQLILMASISAIAYFFSVNFIFIIIGSGLLYLYLQKQLALPQFILVIFFIIVISIMFFVFNTYSFVTMSFATLVPPVQFLISGLKTGLLTFGGAYTSIPFLQHDAVEVGGYITNQQFLDGLVLSGIIPAPLIIFGTFVGFVGGGILGALMLTLGIFLPAFSLTLLFHNFLEKLIKKTVVRTFLDGLTAGVVGMIIGTSIELLPAAISDIPQFFIFALALICLYRFQSKATIFLVMFVSCSFGFLLSVI